MRSIVISIVIFLISLQGNHFVVAGPNIDGSDNNDSNLYASMDASVLEPRRRAVLAEDLLNQVQPIFPFAVSFCRNSDIHEESSDSNIKSEESIRLQALALLEKRQIFPTSQQEIKQFYDLGKKFCANEDYPFGNLRLALWGLLEYNDYEVLKLFQQEPRQEPRQEQPQQQRQQPSDPSTVQYQTTFGAKSVLPHTYAYYRWVKPMDFLTEPPQPSKTFPLFMYSFLTLGQRSIPFNVPRTRQNIEAIVSQAVTVKHGVLTPILSLALGRAILEQNKAFASASKPITPFSAFSQVRRKSKEAEAEYFLARKQMAKVVFHLKSLLDEKARLRRSGGRGGREADHQYNDDDSDHGDSVHDGNNDGDNDRNTGDDNTSDDVPQLEKEALKDVAFLAYLEYKSLITNAYGTLLMANMRVKWYDVFHHLPESKYSLQHSRFMKTMSFYGRLFLRAGLAAIQAAPAEYPRSVLESGRLEEWTALMGVSDRRRAAVLRMAFVRDELDKELEVDKGETDTERRTTITTTTTTTTTATTNDRSTLLNDLVCLPGPSKHWPWYLWNGMAKLHQAPWMPILLTDKEKKRFGVEEMPGIFASETSRVAFASPHAQNNALHHHRQHHYQHHQHHQHHHHHHHYEQQQQQQLDQLEFCTDVPRGGSGGTHRHMDDEEAEHENEHQEEASDAQSEPGHYVPLSREESWTNSHTSARSPRKRDQ